MKKVFRKIATVAGTALLIGSTVGMAAAVSYPNDTAVVYGAGAATSDMTAAMKIATNVQSGMAVETTTATVEGGDSYTLEKTSDMFNFNETLSGISGYSDLTKDELTAFLADGTYDSGDVDEDYEQTITLGSEVLSLFTENDYENDEPTVGFLFDNNDHVLNYTITFDDGIAFTDMNTTDMPFLGSEYYVLEAEEDKVTLLDSASTVILSEGETKTVNGKTVSISYIDEDDVKFTVDGELTDKIAEGSLDQLADDSYIVVTENLYASKETGVSKVEFSIGSGKIILETGKDIIIGEDSDDDIDNLVAFIENDSVGLTSITVSWTPDEDTFLTESNAITMPGLGVISLVYGGLDYPSAPEEISLDNGETLTLNMGNYDIPLMWYNSTGAYVQGEENNELVIATGSYTYANAGFSDLETPFWGTLINNTLDSSINTTTVLSTGLALQEDDRFVVTRLDADLSDVETLYYEVSELDVDDGVITLTLNDMIGTDDLSFDDVDETDDNGDVTATLVGLNSTNETAYVEFSTNDGTITYNKVVSEKGMIVTIPTAAEGASITFQEADKDEDIGEGVTVNVTVSNSTNDKLFATLVDDANVSKEETLSDDKHVAVVLSDLASKIATDESGDEYDFSIEYFGEEVTAEVKVTTGEVSSTTSELGVKTVTDTEVSTVSSSNLIVVGGSAINSVAAELLGGSFSEGDFTEATGVGADQYMIATYASPYSSSKTATLVAGYEAQDTTRAADDLVTSDISLEVGQSVVKTSVDMATVA